MFTLVMFTLKLHSYMFTLKLIVRKFNARNLNAQTYVILIYTVRFSITIFIFYIKYNV